MHSLLRPLGNMWDSLNVCSDMILATERGLNTTIMTFYGYIPTNPGTQVQL